MTEADLPERPEFENPDLDAARIAQQNSGSMAGGQQGIVGNHNTQTQTQYIYNYSAESAKAQRPRNEKILLDAVKQEVNQRLKQSLHKAVLIQLQMDTQPEQVEPNRLWEAEVKIGTRPPEPLPVNATIQDVFDQEEIAHKLLILGAPGSGKTTTMLDLAKALVNRAEQDASHPIPVMFNLSSWTNDQQSIKDWLLVELKLKYGVRQTVGKQWIEEKALIPLLDGLDELVGERQEHCVSRINELLQSEDQPTQVLVCSRLEEYENYETKLNLNGAICLRPLTDQQLDYYFAQLQQTQLQQLFTTDADLQELIHTPLWLSISILAIDELDIEQWQQQDSLATRREQLLDAYIRRMLSRLVKSEHYSKGKKLSSGQIKKWLMVLAKQLQMQSKDEFSIEGMQPANWSSTNLQIQEYRLLVGLVTGVVHGLICGLFLGLNGGIYFGITSGLMWWLNNDYSIKAFDFAPNIGLKSFLYRKDLLRILLMDLLISFIIGCIGGLILGQFFGLTIGVISALIVGVVRDFLQASKAEIQISKNPNQGVFSSAKILFVLLILCCITALFVRIFIWKLLFANLNEILALAVAGITIFTLVGITIEEGGGEVVQKHFALRCTLYLNGLIPWNYARFLNYCTDRLLLQRVGGRYRFIHKLLQEHFANMPIEK